MSESADDDQPLNFGSDLSLKACLRNCLDGECCDCDESRQEPDEWEGQTAPGPYQQVTAREPLLSIASSGRGPSQPRPMLQQYQSTQPMHYGSASYAGRGNSASHGDHPASYAGRPWSYAGCPADQGGHYPNHGGVFINPQYPPGFTTQASSYQEVRDVTPLQESRGWFRDHAGRLCNGRGEHIDDKGDVIQHTSPGTLQASPTSDFSGDGSVRAAPSHHSVSTEETSRAGSHRGIHNGKKRRDH